MIIDLLVRPIRTHDREGNLTAAGVEWTEQRLAALLIIGPVAAVGAISLMWGFAYGVAQGFSHGPIAAMSVGAIALFSGMLLLLRCAVRKRSLLFRADGSISAPQGLPGLPQFVIKHTGFIGHAQIRSIEVDKDPKHGIDVRIYSSEGDKIVVGRSFFEPDFALKIAVLLQKALHDIRRGYSDDLDDEVAGIDHEIRAATAHARPGDTINITID